MIVKELDLKRQLFTVVIEDDDDLYYLSLVIEPEDVVRCWTTRTVRVSQGYTSKRGEKVSVFVGLKVKDIEFHEFTGRMRIKGIIVECPDYLHAKGKHHTVWIKPGDEVTVLKEHITNFHVRLLSKKKSALALILSIGEEEIALAFLRDQGIEIAEKIEVPARKDGVSLRSAYTELIKKAREEFLKIVSLRKNIKTAVVLTTPLLKPWVKEHLLGEIPQSVAKNLSLTLITVSEGGISGIYEFLRSGKAHKMVRGLKVLQDYQIVEELFKLLAEKPEKVAIGLEEVEKAASYGAVDKLVVLDEFFRQMVSSTNFRNILDLVSSARGEVYIISRHSEAGLKMKRLKGIAAILRFPLFLKDSS